MNRINKNFKHLREESKKTKTWIASKISKSVSVISNYETGKAMPPLPVIEQYAELFGVYIGDMVGCDLWLGEGGNPPEKGKPDTHLLREKEALHGLLDDKEERINTLRAEVMALAKQLKADPAAKEYFLAISEVLAHLEKR